MGYVTSGTMVPYWKPEGDGVESQFTDEIGKRAIAMALVSSELWEGDEVEVEIRGRRTPATIVPYFCVAKRHLLHVPLFTISSRMSRKRRPRQGSNRRSMSCLTAPLPTPAGASTIAST